MRAPKVCINRECTTLAYNGNTYCTEHAKPAWSGPRTASSKATSQRRWKQDITPRILDRDHHICQIQTPGICQGAATLVDKIIPAAQRPDLVYTDSNLRAACKPCNDRKARTTDRTGG